MMKCRKRPTIKPKVRLLLLCKMMMNYHGKFIIIAVFDVNIEKSIDYFSPHFIINQK